MTYEKKHTLQRRGFLQAAVPLAASMVWPANAQPINFPNRPIRFILPFSPGGAPDTYARLIGKFIAEKTGQAVIIENRPGGNSIVAAETVAKAAPNGYALLYTTGSHTINPSLYKKLPFDTVKDFAPITQVLITPGLVLVVNVDLPARSVSEFLALGRAGKIAYGSPGLGNTLQLPGALLNVMAGTKLLHVSYRGAAPALIATIGGEIQAVFLTPTAALPVVNSGKVRAIAVTSATRIKSFPDVPTLAESGVPGFDFYGGWNGLFAPATTPTVILEKIALLVKDAINSPDISKHMADDSDQAVGSTPKEFSRFVEEDIEKSSIIKTVGIKPTD
jgi:tripartite-type tricarboxylate transporter receptor subunit TctC